jgi:hypothetical protein
MIHDINKFVMCVSVSCKELRGCFCEHCGDWVLLWLLYCTRARTRHPIPPTGLGFVSPQNIAQTILLCVSIAMKS